MKDFHFGWLWQSLYARWNVKFKNVFLHSLSITSQYIDGTRPSKIAVYDLVFMGGFGKMPIIERIAVKKYLGFVSTK